MNGLPENKQREIEDALKSKGRHRPVSDLPAETQTSTRNKQYRC
jgi:hypothetical protein